MPRTALRLLVGALAIGGSLAWLAAPAASQTAGGSWTLLVANIDSGDVTPVDLRTNAAQAAIATDDGAAAIAITPDAATAYVANALSTTVTPIDIASGTAGDPIEVNTGPTGIAITPDGALAFVVNGGSNNVTVLDIATNTKAHRHRGRSRAVGGRDHTGRRSGLRHQWKLERRHTDRRGHEGRGCADPGGCRSVGDRHHA